MSEKFEKLKGICEATQSIVIVLAVIIGGIWTIYIFSVLRTEEKAKVELDKEKLNANKAQVEQELQKNFGLDISVEAKQEPLASNTGYYISALAKVTNKGMKNRFIDLTNAPFSVSGVEFDENGNSDLYNLPEIPDRKNIIADSIVLRTGTSVSFPFLVRVPEKGFYVIAFSVELNEEEMTIHKKSGGPDIKGISWSGEAVVLVK